MNQALIDFANSFASMSTSEAKQRLIELDLEVLVAVALNLIHGYLASQDQLNDAKRLAQRITKIGD